MARFVAAWPWICAWQDPTGRACFVFIHILNFRPVIQFMLHHSNSTLNLTGTFPPQMRYFRHIVSKHECLLFCAYVLTGIISFSQKPGAVSSLSYAAALLLLYFRIGADSYSLRSALQPPGLIVSQTFQSSTFSYVLVDSLVSFFTACLNSNSLV